MYNKNDKRRLYWLIDEYLLGKIDEMTFCDEFYYCFDLELDKESFNDTEKTVFIELNKVVSRFSQYEEDHVLDSNAFSTIQELKDKIKESKSRLEA